MNSSVRWALVDGNVFYFFLKTTPTSIKLAISRGSSLNNYGAFWMDLIDIFEHMCASSAFPSWNTCVCAVFYEYAHKNWYMDTNPMTMTVKTKFSVAPSNHHGSQVWKVLAHEIACVIYQIDSLRQHVSYRPKEEEKQCRHTNSRAKLLQITILSSCFWCIWNVKAWKIDCIGNAYNVM